MSLERNRPETIAMGPDPFSDDFSVAPGAAARASVQVIHGIYAHTMPLAGMTIRQVRAELEERMNIDPEAMAIVDGREVGEDAVLGENQCLNFVKHAGEKGAADRLTIESGKALLTTEEGQSIERPEADLIDMLREEILPPVNGEALPDGLKFLVWRNPYLAVVHQLPPHVRRLRWIADNSPQDFGPETTYRFVRLSLPYLFTFALFFRHGKELSLTQRNELYFGRAPLRSLQDHVAYPALLNISFIERPGRAMAWICTQHLAPQARLGDWTAQLESLLNHTFNGAFNRSSERHEGASWYGLCKGIHPDLHPVQRWEKASEDKTFALKVPWKPAPLAVGEIVDHMMEEQCLDAAKENRRPRSRGLASRFLAFAQARLAAK